MKFTSVDVRPRKFLIPVPWSFRGLIRVTLQFSKLVRVCEWTWAPSLIIPGQSVSPGPVSGKVSMWSLLVYGLAGCVLSPELNSWFNGSISGAQCCCWVRNHTVALTEAVTSRHTAWQSFSCRSSKHSSSYSSVTVAGERGSEAVVLSLSKSFGTWIWTRRMLTRELKDFQIYQIARSCQVVLRTFLCKWE